MLIRAPPWITKSAFSLPCHQDDHLPGRVPSCLSDNMGLKNLISVLAITQPHKPRKLVEELKTPGLEQSHHDKIMDIFLEILEKNFWSVDK
jgi:hypothetical protein